MKKYLIAVMALGWAGLLCTCGEEHKCPYGSQCGNLQCDCNTVECVLFPAPSESIKVDYLVRTNTDNRYIARLFFDLAGVDTLAGKRWEPPELYTKVMLQSPGSNKWPIWPDDIRGNFCQIDKGAKSLGARFSGQCAILFKNGYNATFPFSCNLTSPGVE